MIGLLRRGPAKWAGRPNRAVLRLEAFEGRATPSGDLNPAPPPSSTVSTSTDRVASGPQIVNFTATEISSGVFVISGQVLDANPAGVTVAFGGEVGTMDGTSTTTDKYGYFSETVVLKTDGSDTGWLLTQATDTAGNMSPEASVYCRPTPP